jgi:methyl-accepting chemotaxis protein
MERPDLDTLGERLRTLVPDAIRRRYTFKLGVLVAVVMLLVAASGGVILVQAESAVQQSTEERLQGNANMQAETVGEWNQRMKDQVSFLGTSRRLDGENLDAANEYLESQEFRLPDYVAGVHLVDGESTEVLATTEEGTQGTNLDEAGVPWAQGGISAPSGAPLQEPPYVDPVHDVPAIAYVLETNESSGRVLVMVVDLEARSEALADPSDDTVTVVVNDRGRIVLSRNAAEIGEHYTTAEGVESKAISKGVRIKSIFPVKGKFIIRRFQFTGNNPVCPFPK